MVNNAMVRRRVVNFIGQKNYRIKYRLIDRRFFKTETNQIFKKNL